MIYKGVDLVYCKNCGKFIESDRKDSEFCHEECAMEHAIMKSEWHRDNPGGSDELFTGELI